KLSPVRPDDLAAKVLGDLIVRVGVDPAEVEDVILGCVDQLGEQGFNIARNAALIAGLPLDVCGTTLDRMCGSGQQAANFGAMAEGRFKREIVPVTLPDGSLFDTDEGVRVPVNREKMAALQPSFKPDGVITAANSSQISDGAAALLFMSGERARALGLRPRARVVATALAGVDPTIMLTGPIPATQRALKKAGLRLDDIDLFEINEAFASVVLAWERELHPRSEEHTSELQSR